MRCTLTCLVASLATVLYCAAASATPVLVINETWPGWSAADPGRQQNEPLDFDVHLGDSGIAGALNNTNALPFVSASGYVYTGQQGANPWAFSVQSAAGLMFDFTQGTQDLSFRGNNSSGAQFRILLSQSSGSGYYVSDEIFGAGGWTTYNRDLDTMSWHTFDPGTMTLGAAATPDFTGIHEVGFASLLSHTAAERIDNIIAYAEPLAPELIYEQWTNATGPDPNIPLTNAVLSDSRGTIALNETGGGPFVSTGGKYIFTGESPTLGRRWAFSLKTATDGTIDFTAAARDLAFDVYNSGGQFRVLLSTLPGADYIVSEQTFTASGWPTQQLDLDAMTWRAFYPDLLTADPSHALGGIVTPDLTNVWEVGFASLVTSGTERIDNVSVRGFHTAQTYTGPLPELLAYEPWATWDATAPGRDYNEPLDGAAHLTSPDLAVGLNQTNDAAFVSYAGYVFTGNQAANPWAFTLRPPLAAVYVDFSVGSQDLQFDQGNSGGGQFRIVVAGSPGGDYAISDEVFDYQRTGGEFDTQTIDLDALTWYDFDPGSMSMGSLTTPDFSQIWEVGFASLITSGTERIDNIWIRGVAGVPEPASLLLLAAAFPGLALLGRRRRLKRR